MAIDYATLIGDKNLDYSLKNLCNDSRVPSVGILQEAQQWIYKKLRVRQMLTSITGTLAIGDSSISLPANFRYPKFFMFTPSATTVKSVPRFKTVEFVVSNQVYDGTGARIRARPQYYATDSSKLFFDTESDKAYPYLWYFYQSPADLSPSNTTNFLTNTYLSLLKAVCLKYCYEHLQNERMMAYWAAQSEKEVYEANVDSDIQLEGMELDVVADDGIAGGIYGYGQI